MFARVRLDIRPFDPQPKAQARVAGEGEGEGAGEGDGRNETALITDWPRLWSRAGQEADNAGPLLTGAAP